MSLRISNIIVSVLGFVSLVLADGAWFTPVVLDSGEIGASCAPILKKGSKDAFVSVRVSQLQLEKGKSLDDVKIPILVGRYLDFDNFSSAPHLEDFVKEYSGKGDGYKKYVDWGSSKFKLDVKQGYPAVDDKRVRTDYIQFPKSGDKSQDHGLFRLDVPETGVYCVLIAPPVDAGIKKLQVPVKYRNSYGYLPFSLYEFHSKIKYAVLIGVLTTIYFIHFMITKKLGKDFKNMSKISVISRAIVFYIQPAHYLILCLWLQLNWIRNKFISSDTASPIYSVLRFITLWLSSSFDILISFAVLLFAMGYGVIYYHRPTASNFRLLPKPSLNKALILLVCNLSSITLAMLLEPSKLANSVMYDENLPLFVETTAKSATFSQQLYMLFISVSSLFPIIWFVFTIVFYFKTKKTIKQFPPAPAGTPNADEMNQGIVTSFRKSLLVLFVLPFFVILIVVSSVTYSASKYVQNDGQTFDNSGSTMAIVRVIEIQMTMISRSSLLKWTPFLINYALYCSLFFIWIRDNNGLVVDNNEQGYSDPAQFDVTDSDDEREHTSN